ncbi:MAG: lysophospholipid acyltransferase family protein [Thermoanaerobaculia bacterium]
MNHDTRRRLRSRLARPVVAVFGLLVGSVSWRAAQRVGRGVGRLLWRFGTRDRERTLEHLSTAFPELPETDRERLGRDATRSIGVSLAEYFHLARRGPQAVQPHLEIDGWEHVVAARAEATVVMIATGHCGNWELMGPVFHSRGEVLTGLVRSLEDEWMEAAMKRVRARLGSRIIPRGERRAATKLLSLRREGGFLLALIDQDIRAQSVYVPFFGKPAHTPVGPAQLALRWSMPVVPGFCERLDDGRHRVRFDPALPQFETAAELTQAITKTIEDQIRRRPDQWVWMHRRWRRRWPDDTEFLVE